MNNVYKKIGIIIRQYRENKGMTQMDLAKKMGYDTPQFVSLFERGLSKVPVEAVGELCVILGLPGDQIQEMLAESAREEIAEKIKMGKRKQKNRKS